MIAVAAAVLTLSGIKPGAVQFVTAAAGVTLLAVVWYRSDFDDVDGAAA